MVMSLRGSLDIPNLTIRLNKDLFFVYCDLNEEFVG